MGRCGGRRIGEGFIRWPVMKGARMNPYDRIMKALAAAAQQDLTTAMILEACLEFTCSELHNATADTYFKERFGERLHTFIEDIIDHM